MTKMELNEAIVSLKMNPNGGQDLSAYLYGAVGLVKQDSSAGTAHLALMLAKEIEKSGVKLSPFCQRKFDLLTSIAAKNIVPLMENFAQIYEFGGVQND